MFIYYHFPMISEILFTMKLRPGLNESRSFGREWKTEIVAQNI